MTNYWDGLQRLVGVLYPDNTTISNIYTFLDVTAKKDDAIKKAGAEAPKRRRLLDRLRLRGGR